MLAKGPRLALSRKAHEPTMSNCSMNATGQWATTPRRKPTLDPPEPNSSHAHCAPPRTDGRRTPMTMSSACARTLCSFNAVISATNNSPSTKRLPISSNAYYPCSPNWFSPRKDIASVSGTGTRHNWRHSPPSSFPQIRRKPLLRCS